MKQILIIFSTFSFIVSFSCARPGEVPEVSKPEKKPEKKSEDGELVDPEVVPKIDIFGVDDQVFQTYGCLKSTKVEANLRSFSVANEILKTPIIVDTSLDVDGDDLQSFYMGVVDDRMHFAIQGRGLQNKVTISFQGFRKDNDSLILAETRNFHVDPDGNVYESGETIGVSRWSNSEINFDLPKRDLDGVVGLALWNLSVYSESGDQMATRYFANYPYFARVCEESTHSSLLYLTEISELGQNGTQKINEFSTSLLRFAFGSVRKLLSSPFKKSMYTYFESGIKIEHNLSHFYQLDPVSIYVTQFGYKNYEEFFKDVAKRAVSYLTSDYDQSEWTPIVNEALLSEVFYATFGFSRWLAQYQQYYSTIDFSSPYTNGEIGKRRVISSLLLRDISGKTLVKYFQGRRFESDLDMNHDDLLTRLKKGWMEASAYDPAFDPIVTSDADKDGLADFMEPRFNADKNKFDSDSDGWSDVAEIRMGKDPRNSTSYPHGLVMDQSFSDWINYLPSRISKQDLENKCGKGQHLVAAAVVVNQGGLAIGGLLGGELDFQKWLIQVHTNNNDYIIAFDEGGVNYTVTKNKPKQQIIAAASPQPFAVNGLEFFISTKYFNFDKIEKVKILSQNKQGNVCQESSWMTPIIVEPSQL